MRFLWKKRADVAQLMRLDRPYGTLLLLCPTMGSLFWASEGWPTPTHFIAFCLGTFTMRSAGCVVNDMADRKFDARILRTRNRPLAAGRLTLAEALSVLGILLTFAFALVLMLNRLTIYVSFAALGVALLYPFAKRFTPLPQIVLGIAFSFGIPMAWTATHGTITFISGLLFFANLFWTVGYDTVYAMMDREEDRKIGVQSAAVFFGSQCRAAIGLLYTLTILFLFWAGREGNMGAIYRVALAVAAGAFSWQVVRLKEETSHVALFAMFRAHVWIGFVILVGIVLGKG